MAGPPLQRPGQSQRKQAIAIPMEEVIKPMQREVSIVYCFITNAELNPQPFDIQVRTLMHDYLTDQDRGSDANIKPLTTINDVLRHSKSARDRHKVRFLLRYPSRLHAEPEGNLRSYFGLETPTRNRWRKI